MRSTKRLGRFLLKGFLKPHPKLDRRASAHQKKVRSKKSHKNQFASRNRFKRYPSGPILSLAKMQGLQMRKPLPQGVAEPELEEDLQPKQQQQEQNQQQQPAQELEQRQELVPQQAEQIASAATIPVPVVQPKLEESQSELQTQDLIRPNDQLRQSIEAFLLDQRSPHTRRAYGKDLKRFVQFLLARGFQQGIENLNRTLLISYKESLLAEGLEHTTVDRHLATLRSFFKWLVDDGLIVKSPAEGVRFLNPKRISRTNAFTDDEVRKLLAVPNLHTRSGAMHYAILMVLFYCGLRRSELCELKTFNIATERGHRILKLRGKGNAERVIVMLPAVWNSIRYYYYIANRNFDTDSYLFTPLRNNRTGVVKKALDPSMIFYIVTKYAKLAGIANRVSPHSCRATAISNARDHHVSDRAIQEFAGWASPDMITRYDKRKTSILDSAAHGIAYGAADRAVGRVADPSEKSSEESSKESSKVSVGENTADVPPEQVSKVAGLEQEVSSDT